MPSKKSKYSSIPEWWVRENKQGVFKELLTLDWELNPSGQGFGCGRFESEYTVAESDALRHGIDNGWVSRTNDTLPFQPEAELKKGLEFVRKLRSLNWSIMEDGKILVPSDEINKNPIFQDDNPLDTAIQFGLVSDSEYQSYKIHDGAVCIQPKGKFAEMVKFDIERQASYKETDKVGFLKDYFKEDKGHIVRGPWGLSMGSLFKVDSYGQYHLAIPSKKLADKNFLKKVLATYGIMVGLDEGGKPSAQIPKRVIDILEERLPSDVERNALTYVEGKLGGIVEAVINKRPEKLYRPINESLSGNINVPLDNGVEIMTAMMRSLGILRGKTQELEEDVSSNVILQFDMRLVDQDLFRPFTRLGDEAGKTARAGHTRTENK